MLQLILGYLVLLIIASGFSLGLIFLLRRLHWKRQQERPDPLALPEQPDGRNWLVALWAKRPGLQLVRRHPALSALVALGLGLAAQYALSHGLALLGVVGYLAALVLFVQAVRPVQDGKPEAPPAEVGEALPASTVDLAAYASWREVPLAQRVALFRQHWREATLADVVAGFRPPAGMLPPEEVESTRVEPADEQVPLEPAPADLPPLLQAAVSHWSADAEFSSDALVSTPQGELLAVDLGQRTVYRFAADGELLARWSVPELPADHRPASLAAAASPDGQVLYVADAPGHRILAIDLGRPGDVPVASVPHRLPPSMQAAEKPRAGLAARLRVAPLNTRAAAALVGAVLLLLVVGQYIIIGRLWWGASLAFLEPLRKLSCAVPVLCHPYFSPYFALALTVLLGAAGLGAWLAHQRWASGGGRYLALLPDPDARPARADAWFLAGMVLSWLAVAGWGGGRWELAALFTLLMAGSMWLSRRAGWRPETLFGAAPYRLALLGLGLIMLVATAYGIRSWRWSVVGDEYTFYFYARDLFLGKIPLHFFGAGAYDVHPVAVSWFQSLTMRLFGPDSYGWRISEALFVVSSVPGLWLLARLFVPKRTALLAAGLVAGSHFLLSFGKTGYAHTSALIPFFWAPALLGWGLRSNRRWLVAAGGVAAGVGMYTFALGRVTILPVLLMLLINAPPFRRREDRLRPWLTVLVAWFVVAAPVLLNSELWQRNLTRSSLGSMIELEPGTTVTSHILHNLFYSVMLPIWSGRNSHWTFGPHLDPVSSMLAVLGTALLLAGPLGCNGERQEGRRARWWLLGAYLVALLATAGTNQYAYPSNTRMFIMVPFYALWAAIGARQLMHWLAQLLRPLRVRWRPVRLRPVADGLLIAVVVLLGIYQMRWLSPGRIPQPFRASLGLRIVQEERPEGQVCLFASSNFNLAIPEAFYSAYHITPQQWLAFNQVPPPIEGTSCDVILLDVGLPDVDSLSQSVRQFWPELTETLGRDEAGVLHFIRFDLHR